MPQRTAMIQDLSDLVSVESPSRDLNALAESAAAVERVIDTRLGGRTAVIETAGGPMVHWSGGGDPAVLLLGHHDTVFPRGSIEARPFRIDGARATGPGVFDMKGGIVQGIHAVASLADRRGVELLLTADEEVGSAASRSFVEQRAVACAAVLVLEPSADGGALKTARKGVGRFGLHVQGLASHAGLEPDKGVNALIEAAHQILRISAFGDRTAGTTVTPTVAEAGAADNVVPARARVVVDARVDTDDERLRVERAMADLTPVLAGTSLALTGGFYRPPMPSAASTWLFPLAVEAAREVGIGDLHGVAVGGGSDGNFTAAAGVATLDGLGAVGGGAHADHEWIDVEAMVHRARLVAAIIRRISDSRP